MGPDVINVSWNADEYIKNGLQQFRLVAESSRDQLSIVYTIVNASDSKGSIVNNITQLTNYKIYAENISNMNILTIIQKVTTLKSGKQENAFN